MRLSSLCAMPSAALSVVTYKFQRHNIMATSFGWTLVAMFVLIAALFLPVAVSARSKVAESVYAEPEVRAVWLTTNGGLDWPGRTRGVEAQKR